MKLVKAKEALKILGITSVTLNSWKRQGKIGFKQINKRKVLYDIESVLGKTNPDNKLNVIYARVSNTKQSDDLERQISIIKNYMSSNGLKIDKVYQDIASGMNENRKSFNKLIEDVCSNKIENIFITYNDRLTRFGFSYFQTLFKKFDTHIIVLNSTDEKDFKQELLNDMISIIHHFSMKFYSNRRKQLKNVIKGIYDLKNNEEFQDK